MDLGDAFSELKTFLWNLGDLIYSVTFCFPDNISSEQLRFSRVHIPVSPNKLDKVHGPDGVRFQWWSRHSGDRDLQ